MKTFKLELPIHLSLILIVIGRWVISVVPSFYLCNVHCKNKEEKDMLILIKSNQIHANARLCTNNVIHSCTSKKDKQVSTYA